MRDDFQAALAELEAPAGSTEDTAVVESADAPAADAPAAATDTDRSRDASGRFAPRTPSKDTLPADKEPATQEPLTAQAGDPAVPPAPGPGTAPAVKAPVSWRPEEREGWEKLEPRHQQAILRREQETARALSQTAEARQIHQELTRIMQPYQHFLQAENATPVQAVESLMRTAAALRTAPPGQKATLVADMIMQFGIPLDTLDTALQHRIQGRGGAVQHQMDPVVQMVEQRLAPLQQFMQEFQQFRQQGQQRTTQAAEQTLAEFAQDPANEFLPDVAKDMADILELASNRGQQMSLQDAYRRATLLHPTISKIVEQRQQAQRAAQHTAAAQRARNAAVSLSQDGAPTQDGGEAEVGNDIRSAISASIRQHSRQTR